MHLVTGMALAALFRNRERRDHSPLLRRDGPVRTEHQVPGRVRFRVPSLVGSATGKSRLEENLPRVEGLDSVEVSTLTGSVLIRYRPDRVRPELLCAAIVRLLGLEEELVRLPEPRIAAELRDVFDALNRAVHQQTGGLLDLRTAIPLLLALLGGRQLLRQGLTSMPSGLALLWWAYLALFPGGTR